MEQLSLQEAQIIEKMSTTEEDGSNRDSGTRNTLSLPEKSEKPLFNEQTNYVPTGKIIMVLSIFLVTWVINCHPDIPRLRQR